MRFLLHDAFQKDLEKALIRHEHVCHALAELTGDGATAPELAGRPDLLLPLLEKKQWNLITAAAPFVHAIYEQHVAFHGVIILILSDPDAPADQGHGIDRLFERYKRLTPRRLYTITPSRVKIRQLPGAV